MHWKENKHRERGLPARRLTFGAVPRGRLALSGRDVATAVLPCPFPGKDWKRTASGQTARMRWLHDRHTQFPRGPGSRSWSTKLSALELHPRPAADPLTKRVSLFAMRPKDSSAFVRSGSCVTKRKIGRAHV